MVLQSVIFLKHLTVVDNIKGPLRLIAISVAGNIKCPLRLIY